MLYGAVMQKRNVNEKGQYFSYVKTTNWYKMDEEHVIF
jgi:hypothetical protein